MVERLQESHASLEQKVDERTRELATGARRAGREDVARARGREPTQKRVPGEHVARVAHAAQRDHRVRQMLREGQVGELTGSRTNTSTTSSPGNHLSR